MRYSGLSMTPCSSEDENSLHRSTSNIESLRNSSGRVGGGGAEGKRNKYLILNVVRVLRSPTRGQREGGRAGPVSAHVPGAEGCGAVIGMEKRGGKRK